MHGRNVIGIDFGASFTKLAYRQGFTAGQISQYEERQSQRLTVAGHDLIPTQAIETGRKDQPWVFGLQAAGMKPGKGMTLHRNWKAELLQADGRPPSASSLQVAQEFFGWLLKEISKPGVLPFRPDKAAVMLCVPAFNDSGATLTQLAAVMEEAGWKNNFILKTTEPEANTIGFCTEGRNLRTAFNTPNWGEMFGGLTYPFIRFTRDNMDGDAATLAVLDIGSFTSDLSLIHWHPGDTEGYLNGASQVSFRHGIVGQLDQQCLPQILDDAAETMDSLGFAELEAIKQKLYCGESYDLGGFTLGTDDHLEAVDDAIQNFCDDLWKMMEPVLAGSQIRWFKLTGGGACIPGIEEILSSRLSGLTNGRRPPHNLGIGTTSRIDTAIGSTSLIFFAASGAGTPTVIKKDPAIEPLPPLRSCPCGGINPQCMRCGGSGIISDHSSPPPKSPKSTVAKPSKASRKRDDEVIQLEPEDITAPDEETLPEAPVLRFSAKEIAAHTLEGWMGTLVFGAQAGVRGHRYRDMRKLLESPDIESRNAAWYRLLCLACALGAKVPRSVIQKFWTTTLDGTGFWQSTTGPERDPAKIDRFFENLIHREFRSIYAEGEDSELLRRVFYDFRKLHFLTYQNDFADVILDILREVESGADPVRFLRSGWLPNDRPWKGVIGQSMTSPLLFLMREWRRAGMIASNRMDRHCYYMNTAARRGACRKGWLPWDKLYSYSLQGILDASSVVHEKLMESEEWDPMNFDIPLQILGGVQRRRRA